MGKIWQKKSSKAIFEILARLNDTHSFEFWQKLKIVVQYSVLQRFKTYFLRYIQN